MLTYEQIAVLGHRNTIELVSTPWLVKEPVLFAATLARAQHHLNNPGTKVTIFGNERANTGWLEFSMRVEYPGGGGMFIGCIQRTADAEPEFHS